MKKIAVIYSSDHEFQELKRLFPYSMDKFHRVSNIEHTRGMEFSDVITLGNAHKIIGYDEVYYAAKERVR